MTNNLLFHGTTVPNIRELEPHLKHTPGVLKGQKKSFIYAASNPAYAASHGFAWTSDEGIDVGLENGIITLFVPAIHRKRLDVKLYVYTLPGDNFNLLEKDKDGCEIFVSQVNVKPLAVREFSSVQDAVEFFGGKVIFYQPKQN